MTALHDALAANPRTAVAAPAPASAAVQAGHAPHGRTSFRKGARSIAPGLALALAVAAVATVVGQHVPLVGSAVPGAGISTDLRNVNMAESP